MSTLADVKKSALNLLARREHSRLELYHKLSLKKFPADLIQQALDQVKEKGWQSDLRFVQAYISSRAQRGYGPLRIQAELQEKGISKDLIHSVFDVSDIDWQHILIEVHQKKFGNKSAKTATEYAKRLRFLQYRGFSMDQIRALK